VIAYAAVSEFAISVARVPTTSIRKSVSNAG